MLLLHTRTHSHLSLLYTQGAHRNGHHEIGHEKTTRAYVSRLNKNYYRAHTYLCSTVSFFINAAARRVLLILSLIDRVPL